MNKKIILTFLFLLFCIKIHATEYPRMLFLSNTAYSNLQFNKDLFFDTVNVGSNDNSGTSPLTPLFTLDYALSELRDNVNIDTLIIISGEPYSYNAVYISSKNIISNWAIVTTPKNSNIKYLQKLIINNIIFYDLYMRGNEVGLYGFFYKAILNNCIVDSSFVRRTNGSGFFAMLTAFNNCVVSNNFAQHSSPALSTFMEIDKRIIKNNVFFNNYTNCASRGFFFQRDNPPSNFTNNIIQNNTWSSGYNMFGTAYNNSAETNIVYNNLNTTNLNTNKITEQINFTKVGNDTYYEFNENRTEFGLTDTAIKKILLSRYSYMTDTLAALIISPKLKNNDNRASVVYGYEANKAASILSSVNMPSDTAAAILSSVNMPSDTAAAILSAGDTYFNNVFN